MRLCKNQNNSVNTFFIKLSAVVSLRKETQHQNGGGKTIKDFWRKSFDNLEVERMSASNYGSLIINESTLRSLLIDLSLSRD